jgi:hypothetical protein
MVSRTSHLNTIVMTKRPVKHASRRGSSKSSHGRVRTLFLIILYGFSVIMILQTVFCLISPSNYPISNVKERIPLRSRPDLAEAFAEQLKNVNASFSSVQFLDCPINAKQQYEYQLKSLAEADATYIVEVHLVDNCTATWTETRFLSFEKVRNLDVSLDGRSLTYFCSEYEGQKYYTIAGFNLTTPDEVKQLKISFTIERIACPANFIKSPWLFNENYSQFINFPVSVIPVERNKESDLSTFKIDFELPYRGILMEQSGWMDAFIPPQSEWILVNPLYNTYNIPMFEYPIEQNFTRDGDTYIFKTHLSQDNIANTITMVTIPDVRIPILLLIFLFSPFYIPTLEWLRSKKGDHDTDIEGYTPRWPNVRRFLSSVVELYGPILAFVLFIIGGEANLGIFTYMLGITQPLSWLLVLYPLIFYLVFHRAKVKLESKSRLKLSSRAKIQSRKARA